MRRNSIRTCGVGALLLAVSLVARAQTTSEPPVPAGEPLPATETVQLERPYALFVPDQAGEKPLPVLVVLHGSGQQGQAMVEAWRDLAEREQFIVIGPDAEDIDRWTLPADGPHLIKAILDSVAARYPVDLRRVYLFGYSGGGLYALTLGLIESEYFAAVASYAAIWKTEEDGSALQFTRRRIPVKLVLGTGDAIYDKSRELLMKQLLRRAKVPAEVTLIEGQGHRYDNVRRTVNDLAWSFLKRQQLTADPVYIDYRLDEEPPP